MCSTPPPPITTRAVLLASGYTRRSLESALQSGEIRLLRSGVYARSGLCAQAATAAAHGGSLGCVSAARHLGLWTLDDADNTVHVWMRGHGHRYPHVDCRCVEHWDHGPADGRFTPPRVARVLRQILACQGVEAFFVSLESALHQRLITRAGVAWLRTTTSEGAREAIAYARRDVESGLESLLRWRLRGRGLRIRVQVRILAVGRVDVLIGDRLIVELDGKDNHDGPSNRHRDLERDANAAAWGYRTLRFDYAMMLHDWATVEDAIMGVVDAGGHLAPGAA